MPNEELNFFFVFVLIRFKDIHITNSNIITSARIYKKRERELMYTALCTYLDISLLSIFQYYYYYLN